MRFGKHADPSTVISIAKRSFVPHVCRNAIKEKKTKQCLYLILGCSIYIWSVSWDWGTPRPLLVICQIWLIFKFNNMGFGQSLPFFIAHPFPPFYLSSYLSSYLSIYLSIYPAIYLSIQLSIYLSNQNKISWPSHLPNMVKNEDKFTRSSLFICQIFDLLLHYTKSILYHLLR